MKSSQQPKEEQELEPQRQSSSSSEISSLLFQQQTDLISIVFSFLNWKEIIKSRIVCQKWKEAATITPIAQTYREVHWADPWADQEDHYPNYPDRYFRCRYYLRCPGPHMIPDLWISNLDFGKALQWISIALPKIPGISIGFKIDPQIAFPIAVGEGEEEHDDDDDDDDDDEDSLDLRILSNFNDLQNLMLNRIGLRGRYPFLFQFHQLQSLCVSSNPNFRWELSDLSSGLPNLKHLRAVNNVSLTGNLSDLRRRGFRDTIMELGLMGCTQIKGSIHDLADFPMLEELDVSGTFIEGDIRKINEHDFPSMKLLETYTYDYESKVHYDSAVYGGRYFDSIEDAPLVAQGWYYLLKKNYRLTRGLLLDMHSPDYYRRRGGGLPAPPLGIEFIKAGPRIGWRWKNYFCGSYKWFYRIGQPNWFDDVCEPNWFDPEPTPTPEPSYKQYLREMKRFQSHVTMYKGFTKSPPTVEQYNQLLQQHGFS